MDTQGSSYEVRCPRCDVSFPVETRRCIHCGGPTAASASPPPMAVETVSSFPWNRPQETPTGAPEDGAAAPAGGGGSELPEEAPTSIGATLLRTFGSLIWVVALVAFSILRSCSDEG